MTRPTPTAELAKLAAECLVIEREEGARFSASTPGAATRSMLTDYARGLGIAAGDIQAAVDAAIKSASGAT